MTDLSHSPLRRCKDQIRGRARVCPTCCLMHGPSAHPSPPLSPSLVSSLPPSSSRHCPPAHTPPPHLPSSSPHPPSSSPPLISPPHLPSSSPLHLPTSSSPPLS